MVTETVISDLAIHPGNYLEEVLEEIGMSQTELANRLGRPPQAVNEIINGKKSVIPKTALELEDVLGVPAHIWTGLESEYQIVKAREEEKAQLQEEAKLLNRFPYADLKKLGLVKTTQKPIEKVESLRAFFSVAQLSQLASVKAFQPAFRVTNHDNVSHEAIATWLEAARQLSKRVETEPFDKKRLKQRLPELRALIASSFESAIHKAGAILADCGVALVILPHFKNTKVQGATFWLSEQKAALALTTRGSFADIFWFSFFHEVGHIVLHGHRKVFLEDGTDDPDLQKQEREADAFASDWILPPKAYAAFKQRGQFGKQEIMRFSEEIDLTPDMVLGRLKHDRLVEASRFNDLKRKITIPV